MLTIIIIALIVEIVLIIIAFNILINKVEVVLSTMENIKAAINAVKKQDLYCNEKMKKSVDEIYEGMFIKVLPTIENLISFKVLPAIYDLKRYSQPIGILPECNFAQLEEIKSFMEREVRTLEL